MPQRERRRRSQASVPQARGPQVNVQPTQRNPGSRDSYAPFRGVDRLNSSLSTFFGTASNVVGQQRERLHHERLQEIDRENKQQQRTAAADAMSGATLEDASDAQRRDRDYFQTFKETSAKKNAYEVSTRIRTAYQQWRPEDGPFEAVANGIIDEEIGEGTGDEFYDSILTQSVYENAEPLIRESEKKTVAQSLKTAQNNVAALSSHYGRVGDHSAAEFVELKRQALDAYPNKTEGEASAIVMSAMANGARTGGKESIHSFLRFLHNEPITDDGKSFYTQFPEQARQLDMDLTRKHQGEMTFQLTEAVKGLQGDLQTLSGSVESDPKGVIDQAIALRLKASALADRHGGTSAIDKLDAQIAKTIDKANDEYRKQQGTVDALSGGDGAGVSVKEVEEKGFDMMVRLHGASPWDPELPSEDRTALAARWATSLNNLQSAKQTIPPEIKSALADGLRPGNTPAQRQASLQVLQALDAQSPGAANKLLKGDATSSYLYRLYKNASKTGTFDAVNYQLESSPKVIEQAAKLSDSDVASYIQGDDGFFNESDDIVEEVLTQTAPGGTVFDNDGLTEYLEDQGVIDDADSFDIADNSELAAYIRDTARLQVAQAQAEGGRKVTVQSIQKALGEQLKGTLSYRETSIRADGWVNTAKDWLPFFEPDRKKLLDFSKVEEFRGEPSFDGPAKLGPRVENPAGTIENTQETMREDINTFSEQFGHSLQMANQNSSGVSGMRDLLWVNPDTQLQEPVRLHFGQPYSFEKGEAYAGEVQQLTDELIGTDKFKLKLTGDIDEDRATVQAARDSGYLPSNVSLVPMPSPTGDYYQLQIHPRFKDKPEDWIDDAELRERAQSDDYTPPPTRTTESLPSMNAF